MVTSITGLSTSAIATNGFVRGGKNLRVTNAFKPKKGLHVLFSHEANQRDGKPNGASKGTGR